MDKNKYYSPCVTVVNTDSANGCWKRCILEMVNVLSSNNAEPSFDKEYNNLLLENRDLKKQYKMTFAALDSILSQKDIDPLKVPDQCIRKEKTLFANDKYQSNVTKLQDVVSDSSCSKVPVKLQDVATRNIDEGILKKETQVKKIVYSKTDELLNTTKIRANSPENEQIIEASKSPKIAKLQEKLQHIPSGDGVGDNIFKIENIQTIKSSGSNCIKSPNIVKIQEKLQELASGNAGEDSGHDKEKAEIETTSNYNCGKFCNTVGSIVRVEEGKVLFKELNCESTFFQNNKHTSTNAKKLKKNVEPSICLQKVHDSRNTTYLKKSTQTVQEVICSNCEKLKPDNIKKHNFVINSEHKTTDKPINKEDYCKVIKELGLVNEQNINLRTELCNKNVKIEGLKDRVQSLELSLKTLTEAINLQDDQLSEYGSVVTSLRNARSVAIEKMMEANQRNNNNIMIIKNIEKEVEQLRRQLDAYNDLLINQNTELIDKASSTDESEVQQNSYTDTLKKKDNYIKLLQDRLCEAIVDLKNKDGEIKNHSYSVKCLINEYEKEKKCLEERLKFASISADRMETNKIKQQETMKQLMKLIEFLQKKLEKIDKK